MSRIKLTDNSMDAIMKMSEGNPGAAILLMQMLSPEGDAIDPDAFGGGMGKILLLDTFGIYGTDIYVLHNDICERNMVYTFAILRACQLGFLRREILKDACGRQDRTGKDLIDVEFYYKKVKKQLPNFMDLGVVVNK